MRSAIRSAIRSAVRSALQRVGGLTATANARTYTHDSGTRQYIFGPLDGEIVGRWIRPTQTEIVGAYLYDFRLASSVGRQVVAVPPDATALSFRRGPDAVNVPVVITEAVQASNTLRGGDLSTDFDTFTTAAAAVVPAQGGTVTPTANAGRIQGGWYSRNILDNPDDMTAWTLANNAAIELEGDVDGVTAWHVTSLGDANGNNVREQGSDELVASDRAIASILLRAAEAGHVGHIIGVQAASLSGSSTRPILYVPLTEQWQRVYIDVTLTGLQSGYFLTLKKNASTTATECFVADPMMEVVTGFTDIAASPYQADQDHHWSEYHPTVTMRDMSGHWTYTTGDETASEGGVVQESPVQIVLGTQDLYGRFHQAGAPIIGARAGFDV